MLSKIRTPGFILDKSDMNRDTHNGGLVPDATVDRARLANLLKLLLISGGCLVSCFCIGCDDPLPAYIEPDKILELNVYPQVPPVIEYKHDDVNDVNLIQPRFTPEFLELNIEVKFLPLYILLLLSYLISPLIHHLYPLIFL